MEIYFVGMAMVFITLCIVTVLVDKIATKNARGRFEQEAVDAGHARFDPKTKEFAWLSR